MDAQCEEALQGVAVRGGSCTQVARGTGATRAALLCLYAFPGRTGACMYLERGLRKWLIFCDAFCVHINITLICSETI